MKAEADRTKPNSPGVFMNNAKIRLNRNHIPLNPNLYFKNQEEYDFHIQTLLFLNKQLELGFEPKYFITFHLRHPSERYAPKRETKNALGFKDRYGFNNRNLISKEEIKSYDYYERRRNDYDLVQKDTHQIRSSIGRIFYGIKRHNHLDKFPPMLFFHELGKTKLQYHIHMLLPETNVLNKKHPLKFQDTTTMETELNTRFRNSHKAISNWKRIHIREVDNPHKALAYVNKETKKNHYSIDFQNSILIQN